MSDEMCPLCNRPELECVGDHQEYDEGQRYGRRMRQTWASAEDAAMPFEEWAVMQDTVEFIRECRGDAYLAGFQSVLKEKQPC